MQDAGCMMHAHALVHVIVLVHLHWHVQVQEQVQEQGQGQVQLKEGRWRRSRPSGGESALPEVSRSAPATTVLLLLLHDRPALVQQLHLQQGRVRLEASHGLERAIWQYIVSAQTGPRVIRGRWPYSCLVRKKMFPSLYQA